MDYEKLAHRLKGDPKGLLDLLEQELRQEKAYIAYLEEMLKRANVDFDFNALPEWQRKAYFDKIV